MLLILVCGQFGNELVHARSTGPKITYTKNMQVDDEKGSKQINCKKKIYFDGKLSVVEDSSSYDSLEQQVSSFGGRKLK